MNFVYFKQEIRAALERDPAARHAWVVSFFYPGFGALKTHRMAHFLYRSGVPFLPTAMSLWARFWTGIEIHPGATIGRGLFIDHGMGVVIGETTVIGNDVTLYQQVTLGGTGKSRGKRHPTLGHNVVVGAGAKVLGDITVGDNSMVGSNAVVVRDVPPYSTAVGVPAKIARREGRRVPGINLDHTHLPDPLQKSLEKLQKEIDHIEHEIRGHRQSPPEAPQA
ncbi:MAG: serine O-acetyltransferase [Candidatus Omnitrophica bacterium]|nr:serine O-acetyltransferase [Candidatus Omnitrophota bacterium]